MPFSSLKRYWRKTTRWFSSLLIRRQQKSSVKAATRKQAEQWTSSSEYRPRELFFIFCNARPHLFTWLCKPGFRHCYVVERLDHIWMMYDPTRVGLNVVLPPCTSEHHLVKSMMKMEPGMKVVRVKSRGDGSSLTYRPKLISCVSTLQYVTGIGYPF